MEQGYDMPCYHPFKIFQLPKVNPNEKTQIFWHNDGKHFLLPLTLPCGQCVGCRLERSRQWAIRCVHEASFHQDNSFITLTYSPENIPSPPTLKKSDFQKFIKRLRKSLPEKRIKYYHCGEYGSKNFRPHYHAILFGHDFSDKTLWQETPGGSKLYVSNKLKKLWPYGFSSIGDVTFESAAYVARYIMKKVTGELADDHYKRWDENNNEYQLQPEYTTMSRRPAIAADWIEKYKSDVYPSDEVIIRGKKMRPPKFYDKFLEKFHSQEFQEIKELRLKGASKNKKENTPARLLVKEECKLAQLTQLKRVL